MGTGRGPKRVGPQVPTTTVTSWRGPPPGQPPQCGMAFPLHLLPPTGNHRPLKHPWLHQLAPAQGQRGDCPFHLDTIAQPPWGLCQGAALVVGGQWQGPVAVPVGLGVHPSECSYPPMPRARARGQCPRLCPRLARQRAAVAPRPLQRPTSRRWQSGRHTQPPLPPPLVPAGPVGQVQVGVAVASQGLVPQRD